MRAFPRGAWERVGCMPICSTSAHRLSGRSAADSRGVVTIDDERIVAVGTKAAVGGRIDLGRRGVAAGPGELPHASWNSAISQQPLGSPGMRLAEWIRLVIGERIAAITRGSSDWQRTKRKLCIRRYTYRRHNAIELQLTIAAKTGLNLYTEVIGFSLARADRRSRSE